MSEGQDFAEGMRLHQKARKFQKTFNHLIEKLSLEHKALLAKLLSRELSTDVSIDNITFERYEEKTIDGKGMINFTYRAFGEGYSSADLMMTEPTPIPFADRYPPIVYPELYED